MINYMMWVNIYAFLFLIIYFVVQRHRKSYLLNKTFLMVGMLLSLLLPLIDSFSLFDINNSDYARLVLDAVYIQDVNNIITQSSTDFPWIKIVYPAYGFIVMMNLIFLLIKHYSIKKKIKKFGYQLYEGHRVILNSEIGPGSYGRYIFFPKEEINPLIFKHEVGHIQLHHYQEKTFLRILRCIFFPVIPFHLIYREIELIQEFQADEFAKNNVHDYIELLLNVHFSTQSFSIIQPFYFQPLKRRIMMLKNRNNQKLNSKFGFVFTAVMLTLAVFSCQNSSIEPEEIKNDETQEIFKVVDKMPVFPGGEIALIKFLSENITYPEQAKKDSLEGRVVAEFVINKDGSLDQIKIVNSLSLECDQEVIRVLEMMPPWEPGYQNGKAVKVYYVLPISFQLPK